VETSYLNADMCKFESLQKDESINQWLPNACLVGSLREEFSIPGRKFVSGRSWGGKTKDEKTYVFIICSFNT